LHTGWFADTLPSFLVENQGPAAFLHADADLYESTVAFLEELCRRDRLVKGTVLVFDEYTNYANWEQGEYRAWMEVCTTYNIQFDFFGFHAPAHTYSLKKYGYQSVAVVVTRVGGRF
jgi:Macrocin-O-methyltransferase (TylF)